MSINVYFRQVQQLIDETTAIVRFDVNYSDRGEDTGYIRGHVTFLDHSTLHFREYIDAEFGLERLMYSYHYMDSSSHLIFRYDDADHHDELHLDTHPHHKHDGNEEKIVASRAPTLADVLAEIELLLHLT